MQYNVLDHFEVARELILETRMLLVELRHDPSDQVFNCFRLFVLVRCHFGDGMLQLEHFGKGDLGLLRLLGLYAFILSLQVFDRNLDGFNRIFHTFDILFNAIALLLYLMHLILSLLDFFTDLLLQ